MTTALTSNPELDDPVRDNGPLEPGPHHARALIFGIGAVLVAVLAAVHLLLSAQMRVPIIHPDELGYLDNARYLAHGGLRPQTDYYPGFSLLLVPLWLVSHTALTVWRGALVVNAVLAALGGLVAWMVTGTLVPGLDGWRRVAVAGLVSLYPPFLLYSNLALAESLFVALFGIVIVLAGKAMAGRSPLAWAGLGLATGLLPLVHPRGFAVVLAVALVGLAVLAPWRFRREGLSALAGFALALALGLLLTRVLVIHTQGTAQNGFAAYDTGGILHKNLSLHGAVSLIWELFGQFFYLAVATVGLLPLGLWLGLRSLYSVARGSRIPVELARALAALAFGGVWLLSSLFMNLGDRADKLIYGRYNEGVIVPLLVLALAELVAPMRRRRFLVKRYGGRRWMLVGAVAIVVSAGALIAGRSRTALHMPLNPINVLGIYLAIHAFGDRIHVIPITLGALATLALLGLLARWSRAMAVVLLAGIFVFSAIDSQVTYLVPGSRARSQEDVIAQALRNASATFGLRGACIGYDPNPAVTTDYNYYATRFLLPGTEFRWLDPSGAGAPCGPLVVSARPDFATRFPDARLVTLENNVAESLWVMPGPLQDRLDTAGWLLPQPTPGPLPDAARHALLAAPQAVGNITVVKASHPTTITVQATHDGSGAPWPATAGLGQGAFAVRLAARWYAPGTVPPTSYELGTPLATTTVELAQTVLPGQTIRIRVPLVARDAAGLALAPGLYQVHLVLFQEGAAPFTDNGLTVAVAVRR